MLQKAFFYWGLHEVHNVKWLNVKMIAIDKIHEVPLCGMFEARFCHPCPQVDKWWGPNLFDMIGPFLVGWEFVLVGLFAEDVVVENQFPHMKSLGLDPATEVVCRWPGYFRGSSFKEQTCLVQPIEFYSTTDFIGGEVKWLNRHTVEPNFQRKDDLSSINQGVGWLSHKKIGRGTVGP